MPKNKPQKKVNLQHLGRAAVLKNATSLEKIDGNVLTEKMLALHIKKDYRKLERAIEAVKGRAVQPEGALNVVCYGLMNKFKNAKVESEKKQILECAEYITGHINPNLVADGLNVSLMFMACLENLPEFIALFLHRTKVRADINASQDIPIGPRQTFKMTALVVLFVADYATADKLKILNMLLEVKPRISAEQSSQIISLFKMRDKALIEGLIAYEPELLYMNMTQVNSNNVLSAAIKTLAQEPIKKDKSTPIQELSGGQVKEILIYLLSLMEADAKKIQAASLNDVVKIEKIQRIKNLALIIAAAWGKADIVELLLREGADPLFINEAEASVLVCRNALTAAVGHTRFRICLILLQELKKKISKENNEDIQSLKDEALYVAVSSFQTGLTTLLVENGANPTLQERCALSRAIDTLAFCKNPSVNKQIELSINKNLGRLYI